MSVQDTQAEDRPITKSGNIIIYKYRGTIYYNKEDEIWDQKAYIAFLNGLKDSIIEKIESKIRTIKQSSGHISCGRYFFAFGGKRIYDSLEY